jgi:hypothetical protein
MGGLSDYFPRHAWAVVLGLTAIAAAGLLVPPTAGSAVGLTVTQHLLVVGVVEFGCAMGVAATVLYYRRPEDEREDESEWQFDP